MTPEMQDCFQQVLKDYTGQFICWALDESLHPEASKCQKLIQEQLGDPFRTVQDYLWDQKFEATIEQRKAFRRLWLTRLAQGIETIPALQEFLDDQANNH